MARLPICQPTAHLLDQLAEDLRYALRALRRSPGFSATVILTLGLGIGANAAMFNVVDHLMFRPLAYLRDPGAVHRIYWQWDEPSRTVTTVSTQYARYLDLARWTTSFAQMAAFFETNLAVGEGEAARERRVGAVSATFFDFFNAQPAIGRFFVPAEDALPRGDDVAVLSHGFWQSEYGGRNVQGQQLQVGSVRATIIGVAPQGFAGVNDANPPAVFLPITTFAGSAGTTDARTYFARYQWGFVGIIVRRRPGVTVPQAAVDATQAFVRSWEPGRADNPSMPALDRARPRVLVSSVRPGGGPVPALESRTALWVAFVAAIVLIIACANVANLFLTRTLAQQRDTAVRVALGVSRYRLARQSITESSVLALLGGATALVVARWAGAAISHLLIAPPMAGAQAFANARTLWVTAGLAVATGIVIGIVPSVLSARRDVARLLRGASRAAVSEGARLRATLLVAQATLSVVLLVGAVLFVRSVEAVEAMRMGYDAEHVLLVNRAVRGPFPSDSEQLATRELLLSTGRSIPGVESAAWLSSAPFVSTSSTNLYVEGTDAIDRLGVFTFQATTPDYFRTMGTSILRGRGISADDRAGAPNVAVVSESMARVLWPHQDALGKCFRMRSETAPCTTVIGVAEDMVQRDIVVAERYHYYVSIDQYTRSFGNWMALRVSGVAPPAAETVRNALQRALPGNTYVTVQPLQSIVEDAQRSWRMGATLFVAFGVLALVVAVVGLYGAVAYNVTQRRHEFGVRIAVGAQRRDLLRMVMAKSVTFASAAVVLGVLLSVLLSGWIQPLLFGQSATDATVYAGVGATMLVVAIAASLVPALRASQTDPTTALRAE